MRSPLRSAGRTTWARRYAPATISHLTRTRLAPWPSTGIWRRRPAAGAGRPTGVLPDRGPSLTVAQVVDPLHEIAAADGPRPAGRDDHDRTRRLLPAGAATHLT